MYIHIRSVRAKHFLIHEDGIVKLSGLRSVVSMIEDGARVKVFPFVMYIHVRLKYISTAINSTKGKANDYHYHKRECNMIEELSHLSQETVSRFRNSCLGWDSNPRHCFLGEHSTNLAVPGQISW